MTRPASRFGPAFYLAGFAVIAVLLWAADACLTARPHAQTAADPAWRTCAAPAGYVCLAVDVTTEVAHDPIRDLPGRVQFMKDVKVQASWSSGGWWGGTTRKTLTTNSAGRVTFQVPIGKDIALKTDSSALLVSVINPLTTLPEAHRYIDKTLGVDSTLVQKNVRAMITLAVNPKVEVLR